MIVVNVHWGLFSVEQHQKLFLNEARRLCPVPAHRGADTDRAILQTAGTYAEEQATARVIGICLRLPQFTMFLNTSMTTLLLRLFFFFFLPDADNSSILSCYKTLWSWTLERPLVMDWCLNQDAFLSCEITGEEAELRYPSVTPSEPLTIFLSHLVSRRKINAAGSKTSVTAGPWWAHVFSFFPSSLWSPPPSVRSWGLRGQTLPFPLWAQINYADLDFVRLLRCDRDPDVVPQRRKKGQVSIFTSSLVLQCALKGCALHQKRGENIFLKPGLPHILILQLNTAV